MIDKLISFIIQGNKLDGIYEYNAGKKGYKPLVCTIPVLKSLFEKCRDGKAKLRWPILLQKLEDACKFIEQQNSGAPQVGEKRPVGSMDHEDEIFQENADGASLTNQINSLYKVASRVQPMMMDMKKATHELHNEVEATADAMGRIVEAKKAAWDIDEKGRAKEMEDMAKSRAAELEFIKAKTQAEAEAKRAKTTDEMKTKTLDLEILKAKSQAEAAEVNKAKALADVEIELRSKRLELAEMEYNLEQRKKKEPTAPLLCTVREVAIKEGIDKDIHANVFEIILRNVGRRFNLKTAVAEKRVEGNFAVNQFSTDLYDEILDELKRERARNTAPTGQTRIPFARRE